MKNKINLPGFTAYRDLKNDSLYFSSFATIHSGSLNFTSKFNNVVPSVDNGPFADGCGSTCSSDNGDETCCCEVGKKCVKTAGWCGCKDASALTNNRSVFNTRSNLSSFKNQTL